MIEVEGKYAGAIIFSDKVEETALEQVKNLMNQEFVKGSRVRMMPDIHAGAGCTIGTTMTITDKIVPNLVGVDIGCGLSVYKFKAQEIDFAKLDRVIRELIPNGFNVHEKPLRDAVKFTFSLGRLKVAHNIDFERAILSLGTLGGGNHFIEVSEDRKGFYYLTIHTGSRSLGMNIAKYYQKLAVEKRQSNTEGRKKLVEELKAQGRHREIFTELEKFQKSLPLFDPELAYLEGKDMQDYLHDVRIAQRYAAFNRELIQHIIATEMDWLPEEGFQTVHNYVDIESGILRKGAVSARSGEKLIIPINMRDGSLICIGKGNRDWNYSAPHGAGRLLSRRKAHEQLDLGEFEEQMKDVWTSSVSAATLDEAPGAYKPIEEILSNIGDTVEVVEHIKPLYNFKAS